MSGPGRRGSTTVAAMTTPSALWDAPTVAPAPATRPPLLRLVPPLPEPASAQEPLPAEEDDLLVCPAVGVEPEAERTAVAIARALAEVVGGRRTLAQVRPVLVPRVAHLLDHLVRSGAAEGMRLAGLRLQSPRDGVVEASGRLASPRRCAAFALRVERRPKRWAVTVLEAGLAPDGRMPARS